MLGLCFPVFAQAPHLLLGASRTDKYLPMLEDKSVALVVNPTSRVSGQHLADFLLDNKIQVVKIFAPEHGFRGNAEAGQTIKSGTDSRTGLPVVSLYGKNKKPSEKQLKGVDWVIFDIQDVGVRFYTYISTLHYVMQTCAELGKPLLVLDRPNPNGDYIDGPVLEKEHKSFVGMHPIPVVHGLTIGELAQMINGEGWLGNGLECLLKVVPMKNYKRAQRYELPVKPSPNLPNFQAVRLYPSLCFFEGTVISEGRGTYFPFQTYGFPDPAFGPFSYVPKSIDGMSKYPKHKGKTCYGKDLRKTMVKPMLDLSYLVDAYHTYKETKPFFNKFFTKLAGTARLQQQIEQSWSARKIRKSWEKELSSYRKMRENYLLYK